MTIRTWRLNFYHGAPATLRMNPSASSELMTVLYVSSATVLFTDDQLVSALRSWRDSNARDEITGFLLYEQGNFMQVIEGPAANILKLVKAIALDTRHRGMLILWQHAIVEREFGRWHMGFRKVAELSAEDQKSFHSLLQDAAMDEEFRSKAGRSYQMLLQFKRVCLREFLA